MKRTLAVLTLCTLSSVSYAEPLELDLISDQVMVPAPVQSEPVMATQRCRTCKPSARKPLFSGVRAVFHGLLHARPVHKGKGKKSKGVAYQPVAGHAFDYEADTPAPERTAPPAPPEVRIAPPAPGVTDTTVLPGTPRHTAFPYTPF